MGQSIPCLFDKSKKSATCIAGRSMLHIIIRLFNKSAESSGTMETDCFQHFLYFDVAKIIKKVVFQN